MMLQMRQISYTKQIKATLSLCPWKQLGGLSVALLFLKIREVLVEQNLIYQLQSRGSCIQGR